MLIPPHHRLTWRQLGYVAEFCPLCREIRCCRIGRIGLVEEICGMALRKGPLVGHEARCTACGIGRPVDGTFYDDYADTPDLELPRLIEKTHPSIHEDCAFELRTAEQIRTGQIGMTERDQEILATIRLIGRKMTLLAGGGMTGPPRIALATTAVGILLLFVIGKVATIPSDDMALMVVGGIFWLLIGLVTTLILVRRQPRRLLKKVVIPLLARALQPLRVTQEDLVFSLPEAATTVPEVGAISVPDLWKAIERLPPLPDLPAGATLAPAEMTY